MYDRLNEWSITYTVSASVLIIFVNYEHKTFGIDISKVVLQILHFHETSKTKPILPLLKCSPAKLYDIHFNINCIN